MSNDKVKAALKKGLIDDLNESKKTYLEKIEFFKDVMGQNNIELYKVFVEEIDALIEGVKKL